MSVTLENDFLQVSINEKGAELNSIINKVTRLQHMWSGDPAFWAKTSPILFPIVGTLKNNAYRYNGQFYSLTRHGFARDLIFKNAEQQKDYVTFSLSHSPSSETSYPFSFELRIKYNLMRDMLNVSYEVENRGKEDMYFSIGGHPAFRVPLLDETAYEDYYLQFNKSENAPRWPINADGLIKEEPVPFFKNSSALNLTRGLFNEDALVFKNLRSDIVSIKSTKHTHGLDFYFEGFPYLGIWAVKNADFVCIEPWCGIADSEMHDQELVSKEGIERLLQGKSWSRTWKVRFY